MASRTAGPSLQQLVEDRFQKLQLEDTFEAERDDDGQQHTPPSYSASASRVFLTPAEMHKTPPASPRHSERSRSVATRVVDNARHSLAALEHVYPDHDDDGSNGDVILRGTAHRTTDLETGADFVHIVATDGNTVIVNDTYGSGPEDDGGQTIEQTRVIATPSDLIVCTEPDACVQVNVPTAAPLSHQHDTYSTTLTINGDKYDTEDVIDSLQYEDSISFTHTEPISDDVRDRIIQLVHDGATNIEVAETGDDVFAHPSSDDDSDHEEDATAGRMRAQLEHTQRSEQEFLIDVFEQYARYWAMHIGYANKPYINFGICRAINDFGPSLFMGPEQEELEDAGRDLDVLAYLYDLENTAKTAPEEAAAHVGVLTGTVADLDTLTSAVASEFGLTDLDAQRFTLPWVLRGDKALHMEHIPSVQEWEAFVEQRGRAAGSDIAKQLKELQHTVHNRHGQHDHHDAESLSLEPVLSDAAFHARLHRVDPTYLKAAAYAIPLLGPLVHSETAKRPYVIHLSHLKRGAPFSPPLTFDMGDFVLAAAERGHTVQIPGTPRSQPRVHYVTSSM